MKVEVVLEDRMVDVARRLQVIQDALSLVVLVPAAWARVRGGHALVLGLAVLEILAIALAMMSMVRQLLGRSREGTGIEWLNAFLALVLLLEYASRRSGGGKAIDPALLAGLMALALAFSPRLRRRRSRRRLLAIDDEGIRVRKSLLRRMRIRWADLSRIEEDDRTVWFVRRDGRRRQLSLLRYRNDGEIRDALAKGAAAMSVSYLPDRAAPGAQAPKSTIPTSG